MRVAFVTGGTRGIGRAIVKRLHAAGLRVVFFGRGKEHGDQLQAELGLERCRFVQADMASEAAAMQTFSGAVEEEGAIDLLVNNMGTGEPGGKAVREYDGADVTRVLTVNLNVPVQLTRLAWQHMHRLNTTNGVIINVSSIGSSFSADHAQHIPIYSTTKAALDQFTRAIAVPCLAQDNIRVYTINPGVVDTDMGRGVVNSRFPFDNVRAFAACYNAGGDTAAPEDVADVVLDLTQGRTHGFAPGDAIACFAHGTVVNMAALSTTMHCSSLNCSNPAAFGGGSEGSGRSAAKNTSGDTEHAATGEGAEGAGDGERSVPHCSNKSAAQDPRAEVERVLGDRHS